MVLGSRNVFHEIELLGHDEDYQPKPCQHPTGHPPGSPEKVEVLCARVLAGEELWHEDDTPSNHLKCHSKSTESLIERTKAVRRETQIRASREMFRKAQKRLKKRAEKTLSRWKKRRNSRKDK